MTARCVPEGMNVEEIGAALLEYRAYKVREGKVRRACARIGYRLSKSRSRDPHVVDFGLYAVLDPDTGGAVNPAIAQRWTHSWTLEDVELWLTEQWLGTVATVPTEPTSQAS